ncbi:Lrp/AsnC family transcriptional regulator [Leucobacter muris]|uniref:Lrp/AsnC family transcriptional regulator n=1 Tax=Leucobacter muris TaxID=1935379 RepID=A0ABX5QHY4_9MICO|nr:Lrp/AsnC family transcriptional regulator [Leucobacter muris]QAB18689.1 Lrp/AsnC family transcriptional regulator [Leucobacter muris]
MSRARSMDEKDRMILACLREDGRMPNTRIAERVGLTERTVRKRLQRLTQDQGLKVLPVIDPDLIGLDTCIYVGFNVERSKLQQVAARVAAMPEVRYLAHVAGPWDLLAEAFLGSREHLADFLLKEIGELEGVTSTETINVLRIAKFGYEWEVPDVTKEHLPEHSIAHPEG